MFVCSCSSLCSHLDFCISYFSVFECQHGLNHPFAECLCYIYKSICLNLASFSSSHSHKFESKCISLPPEDRKPVAKVIHSIDWGHVSPRRFDIYILGHLPVCHNSRDSQQVNLWLNTLRNPTICEKQTPANNHSISFFIDETIDLVMMFHRRHQQAEAHIYSVNYLNIYWRNCCNISSRH